MQQKISSRYLLTGALVLSCALAGCSATSGQDPQSTTSPSQSPQAEVAPSPLAGEVVQLADGYFAVTLPQGWSMRDIAAQPQQDQAGTIASVEFVNSAGELMATLRTGAKPLDTDAHASIPEDNILIDEASLDASAGPHFSFITAAANPDSAVISLSEVSAQQQAQFLPIDPAFNYQGGSASFLREIAPQDHLSDVDPDLHGTKRMRAYLESTEYAQLKSLMLSFTQLKEITAEPADKSSSTPKQ